MAARPDRNVDRVRGHSCVGGLFNQQENPMNAIERHGQEVALGIHASTHLKLAIAAFVIAVSVVAASYALAHDTGKGWSYDWACCHDTDCDEIAASRVRTTPEGYIVDGKHFVSHADAKFAPDGRYHACFPTPEFLRCLYVPPSGS